MGVLAQVFLALSVFCVGIRHDLVDHLQSSKAVLEVYHFGRRCVPLHKQHLGLNRILFGTYSVLVGGRATGWQVPSGIVVGFDVVRTLAALILLGAEEQRLPFLLVRLKLMLIANVLAFQRGCMRRKPFAVLQRVRQCRMRRLVLKPLGMAPFLCFLHQPLRLLLGHQLLL